jgi:hypothetical protein
MRTYGATPEPGTDNDHPGDAVRGTGEIAVLPGFAAALIGCHRLTG